MSVARTSAAPTEDRWTGVVRSHSGQIQMYSCEIRLFLPVASSAVKTILRLITGVRRLVPCHRVWQSVLRIVRVSAQCPLLHRLQGHEIYALLET